MGWWQWGGNSPGSEKKKSEEKAQRFESLKYVHSEYNLITLCIFILLYKGYRPFVEIVKDSYKKGKQSDT